MGKLTDAGVRSASTPGLHADGDGLYLAVAATKTAGVFSRSWVVRFTAPDGRRRSMGLGSYPEVGLAAARRLAAVRREAARSGVDPLEAKREARRAAALEAARAQTFRQCAEAYIAAHAKTWRNAKHAGQWRSTLSTYVYPVFGDLPVGAIDAALVSKVLDPIWAAKNETASRVRGRIEVVLDWAKVRGYREGENPARWKGHLQFALPPRRKIAKVKHHAALPFGEIGPFLRQLGAMPGVAARALEFAILTAARTGEVLGARWDEIDLAERTWTVPAERMKAGREHRVPLNAAAFAIVAARYEGCCGAFVFGADGSDAMLSNMALLMCLRRMKRADLTVHGFRSTFRDWAAERTNFPREVAEAALAHAVGDKVEAAYRRSDLFDKRRKLMEAWGGYCEAQTAGGGGDVVRFAKRIKA
ncbi:MAG: tyrosine-type recombinase/integrase [Hyphomonadaceae bacterium]